VGVFRDCPKFFSTPIISGMCKTTNVKFGRCIQRVHPNKSQLKILEKMERGRMQGLSKFFEYPLLSQKRVKLRTSNFVRTLLVSIGTKVHYKLWKSSQVRSEDSQNFSGHPYIGLLCDSSAVLLHSYLM